VAESGLAGFRWDYWYGMLAPAKTPRPLIALLNQEITVSLLPLVPVHFFHHAVDYLLDRLPDLLVVRIA
jgi:hypothetical protein